MLGRFDSLAVALDLDSGIGTNDRALTAAGTIAVDRARGVVALGVGFLANSYGALRTDRHTQATAFALLCINNYLASHVQFL
jgi:hypothetical protein